MRIILINITIFLGCKEFLKLLNILYDVVEPRICC